MSKLDRQVTFQLSLTVLLTGFLTIAVAECRMNSGRPPGACGVAGTARPQDAGQAHPLLAFREKGASRNPESARPSPSVKTAGPPNAVPWTELMQAAADGDVESLRRVLRKGASPNSRSSNGWTPLMWAADGGHSDAVKILVDNGADIELSDKKGTTALMLATMRKRHGVTDVLLKRGASPNASDKNRVTPLMIAASNGDTRTVGKLLALRAEVDARDKSGGTALMRASNVPIVNLLIRSGADVHARSVDGMTPLMAAARDQIFNVIIALLQHGADIRTQDKQGRTARDWGYYYNYGSIDDHHLILEILSYRPEEATLCKAAILGRADVAADLIRSGVNPDDMEKCEGYDPPVDVGTPLMWAVRAGHLGMVKLLLKSGASISEDGRAVVWDAAIRGYPDILKLLLEHGALQDRDMPRTYWEDICEQGNKQILEVVRQYASHPCAERREGAKRKGCRRIIKDYAARWMRHYDAKRGATPEIIRSASSEKDATVLKCLLEAAGKQGMPAERLRGAMERAARTNQADTIALLHKYGVDVNQPEPRGITPLMWASMDCNVRAAQTLIDCGADVLARSKEGQTAIMYAQGHGCKEIVALLKVHGARNDATLPGAAAMGDIELAEKQLRSGVNVNAQDELGWSPLLWACATGQTKMAGFLLKQGAQTSARGRILYSYPRDGGGYVGRFSPLKVAAHNGHTDVVRLLMKHRKRTSGSVVQGPVTLSSTSDTDVGDSLEIALEKGHASVVKALVDHGVDVNAKTSRSEVEGSAALLAAVEAGYRDLVELLLEHGANLNSYKIPQGDSYYAPTALDLATRRGHERIRQLLLRCGADYSKE